MNRLTNLTAARDAQDRMASAIASYSTATVDEVVGLGVGAGDSRRHRARHALADPRRAG